MNANSTRNVVVESGGTQVVAHVGLHALGSFADRLGVGERLSSAVGWSGPGVPVHDRGRVLCQAMLMLAGGGESCTDIESLAAQGRLFGDVCSDTTLYRTFTDSLDGDTLVRARQAIGRIRGEVWERIPAVTGGDDPVILDIDASLVEIHSENKDGTAPNFKGGFGFHPMFCFADATGEALAARLRPSGLSSFLCEVVVHVVGSRRPGKAMANALSACFHPWVPVPSSPLLLFPMLRIAK